MSVLLSTICFTLCWIIVLANPDPWNWACFAFTGTIFLATCIREFRS